MTLHVDFETRSAVDLRAVGAYVYAAHPSTEILCMAWAWDDGPIAWTAERDYMRGVLDIAHQGGHQIHAFNASFERLVMHCLLGRVIAPEQFVCTAAQARSNAYPGALDDCARALGIEGKDEAGYQLMLRLSDAANPAPTHAELSRLGDYCKQDVAVERVIGQLTRSLSSVERADYHLNERINDRGVLIDRELCVAATRYADAERLELNTKINSLTLGVIEKVTQTARIAEYLGLTSVRRDVLDDLLDSGAADDLTELQRGVIELRQAGSNSTTAKFAKMAAMAGDDDRLRGMFTFAGAGQTGRYSSHGAQVHNLARDVPALYQQMIRDIKAGMDPAAFRLVYGDIIYALSRLVRPALIAAPGKEFLIGDFAGVEARGLPWLAIARDEIKAYAQGRDRYVEDARDIFSLHPDEPVSKEQRRIGKVARLALGFGGGVGAFKAMARNYEVRVDEALAALIVANWRKANPWATTFWNNVTLAATQAVRHPDEGFDVGLLTYLCHDSTLWCRLPSGRLIAYPQVRLDMVEGPFGSQFELSALKAQWKPKKGQLEWPRVKLWHGLLVENATQATCNDLLRFAMRNLAELGYDIVTHTHDEIVVELTPMFDEELPRFKERMEARPAWALDFPLVADVHQARRYTK